MKSIAIGAAIIVGGIGAIFLYELAIIYLLSWLGLGGQSSDMIGGEGHWISTDRLLVAMLIPGILVGCYWLGKSVRRLR